jgi:alpha-1,3-rhamnosyltransferase
MPDQALVSVLIPLYNHENYIVSCLESVKLEGWPCIELIIHDDCSNDKSLVITEGWLAENKNHFHTIILEKATQNRGITASLNRLIELANGDYVVCPLASDDQLLKGGIAERVNLLEANPQWLAVYGDAHTIDDNDNLINDSYLTKSFGAQLQNLTNPSLIRMEMIVRWCVPGPVILYRKEAFNPELGVGNYDPNLYLEDRDMYLRLLCRDSLGFTPSPVARYRLHAANAMSEPTKMLRSYIDLAQPLLRTAADSRVSFSERSIAWLFGCRIMLRVLRKKNKKLVIFELTKILDVIMKVVIRVGSNTYFLVKRK